MKRAKKALGVLLVCMALVGSACSGLAQTNETVKAHFADVSSEDWYASGVEKVYTLGLMNGTGDGLFSPTDNVTVAEVITMTARARASFEKETIRAALAEESWYAPYVEYAVQKGYVADGQYDAAALDAPAKRGEVAILFKRSMPEGYYTDINSVSEIPDVPSDAAYHEDVYELYRAGVLTGSDERGTFYPENPIIRAEVAIMITRVALPTERVQTEIHTGLDAYTLVETDDLHGAFETVGSGWLLDNRGGIPRSAMGTAGDFTVTDMKTDEGTALIRELNTVTEGTLALETRLTLSGKNTDGVFLEFQTSDARTLYRLQTVDGAWKYRTADGAYLTVYTPEAEESIFVFNIFLDLTTGTAATYINGTNCGTYPLAASEHADVQNFRYGSTEESLATYAVANRVKLTANYRIHDDFYFDEKDTLPFGYTGDRATVTNRTLCIEKGGYAQKDFENVSGTVIAETELLMQDGMSVSLSDKGTPLVQITVKDGSVYVGETKLYDYHTDIWYRLRIEADTASHTAVIKLNGRAIGEAAFTASRANRLVLSYSGSNAAYYDTVRVYEKVRHDDYVPEPIKPKGEEKYTVGINVCSLWKNGHHYGWAPITPYEEPVLGYYDEGNPESADWEIKYMVEHGIDFQSFCWFPDQKNAPLKELECRYALHDGYMNAEYSDKMKYCLIWECANAKTPDGMDSWKKYYVPYLIENYFKDSRYMTIDNRLVFCVFGAGKLNEANAFGSWQGTKDAFDYLEEEVKKLGFDGVLYLALGTSNETLALMGFDASYAYSWSRDGYKVEHNKASMLASLGATDKMYTVPTVSVGFNDIAWWGGKRYPLMTVEDYRTVNRWVTEEYLPQYGTAGTWKENFVMLSTWNEYGEGTYLMPAKNNGGFGYLDVLREAYTDEKADTSVNTVPTDAQKARITRLYPQHHSMLKYQGYYDPQSDGTLYTSFYTLSADGDETKAPSTIEGYEVSDGVITGTTGTDGYIVFSGIPSLELENVTKLKLRIKVPTGNLVEVFFTTAADGAWDATKSFKFKSTSDEMTDYIIDTTDNPSWKGTLTKLRIDPAWSAGIPFAFEALSFLSDPPKKTFTVNVDGTDFDMIYPSAVSEAGDYLVAFDTVKAPELLSCFAVWDKAKEALTIRAGDHTVVFTVGASTYTVDSTEKALGFTLHTFDGLPMLPLQKLCDALGFVFREEEEEVFVETAKKEYYAIVNARTDGAWEFALDGDVEGWVSSFMSLSAENGYLHTVSLTESTDPTLLSKTGLKLTAEKYDRLEIKVRYRYNGEKPTRIAMFFLTDKDTTWNEEKCIRTLHTSTDSKGEWVTYTFELAEFPAWKDTITRLRFDPFDAVGEMDIDYIRFIEDEDYIDPSLRPFTLRNGDAQAEDVAFSSQNGTVSIVTDGENAYYRVLSNAGKQWLYMYQSVTYKAGHLYTFSYDVRLCDTDINPMLGADTVVYINCNIQYSDPNGKTDHVVLSTPIKISDGWVHCTGKFSVPASSENRTFDKFSVYSNPLTDAGIAYCLDNVTVTEE